MSFSRYALCVLILCVFSSQALGDDSMASYFERMKRDVGVASADTAESADTSLERAEAAVSADVTASSSDIAEAESEDTAPEIKKEEPKGPPIVSIDVTGNSTVVTPYILGVVASKVGEPVDDDTLRRDTEAIFDLGFFSAADFKVSEESDGAYVTYVVEENPIVEEIRFSGNSIYKEDQLRAMCFTAPGAVFNRVFFRNDLQRIREKYQKDGYVLVRVDDVNVDGGIINVSIVEPKIGEIIIQGNKRTKDYVIRRQVKLKEGDLFNATILRHSLSRLQGNGYFNDVSIGFEPSEDPEKVNLVLTVEEGRTNRVGISVGYGTSSGVTGGINYEDTNWQGLGTKFSVGFELGKREQYWISYTQPYMDYQTYSWSVGLYKRSWIDLQWWEKGVKQFEYDEKKTGGYVTVAKNFKDEKWSWNLGLDWHQVDVSAHPGYYIRPELLEQMRNGTNFSVFGGLMRNNMDKYLSYPKGDVEQIKVEQGLAMLGGDWGYTKYWAEMKYYRPLNEIMKFLEIGIGDEDNPILLAARVRVGFSSGDVPWGELYEIGGTNSLRGWDDNFFRGQEALLGNFEIRIPMDKAFSLVAFYDIGRAWNKATDESFSFSNLERGVGMGVRVKTPFGNLRLDCASGSETQVHFGFGEMF